MIDNIKNIFAGKKKNIRLTEFIYKHCNETRGSTSYKRYYRRLARIIENFEQSIRIEVYSDSFDYKVSEEYLHFIRSAKPEKNREAYRSSTVKMFIQRTIAMVNKANREGYAGQTCYLSELDAKDEDSCAVYLTMTEIEKLFDLKLKQTNAQIRDLFVIGCLTALRYSDYSRLTEDNFVNGNITIKTKKTGVRVSVPVHRMINDIIERNKGYSFLNYTASMQNFNKTLKTLCKRAGIIDKVLIERTEGFRPIRKIFRKCELVSSHTARRSGATNMYLAGIQPVRIMLITGHATESAFYKYIRIQKDENARELQSHPFFKS